MPVEPQALARQANSALTEAFGAIHTKFGEESDREGVALWLAGLSMYVYWKFSDLGDFLGPRWNDYCVNFSQLAVKWRAARVSDFDSDEDAQEFEEELTDAWDTAAGLFEHLGKQSLFKELRSEYGWNGDEATLAYLGSMVVLEQVLRDIPPP